MATKTRVANKTQWALLDILAAVRQAHAELAAIEDRNEQKVMDPVIGMYLCHLEGALRKIEVTAIRAQHGEYGEEIKAEG